MMIAIIPEIQNSLPVIEAVGVFLGAAVAFLTLERLVDLVSTQGRIERLKLLPLARIVRALIVLATLLLMLQVLGLELLGVWTALSAVLGLIAVGFVAYWSVLSNFTCAFLILVQRPFDPGDWVEFPTELSLCGRVVDYNLSFTTLEQEGGKKLRVPNNLFFQRIIRVERRLQENSQIGK